MKLSPQGLHLIASFEGYVPVPYNDSADNATIGYGHLIHLGPVTDADRVKYHGVTTEQLLDLLSHDAASFSAVVNEAIKVSLGVIPSRAQARFDALVSLAYNIGGGAFSNSTLVRTINAKGAPRDWTAIGPLWVGWDHDGGKVIPGLLTRRQREFSIFRTGKYPA